jgi:hypothetical protein
MISPVRCETKTSPLSQSTSTSSGKVRPVAAVVTMPVWTSTLESSPMDHST